MVAAAGLIVVAIVSVGLSGRDVARGDQKRSVQVAVARGGVPTLATRPVKLTVEVNGDILVHAPVWQRALQDGHGSYDFAPMLREIRPAGG